MLSPSTTMEVMLIDQLAPLAVCLGRRLYQFVRALRRAILLEAAHRRTDAFVGGGDGYADVPFTS
ncbi:hypothetical protein GCM10010176_086960 [Nonomuraea spiralis]|nr:hypothetical protein GCM10010176_086960 [Nonomuraea spiralis]